jgi:16S rRNA (cytosine967-C5)-methyltransferase
MFQRRFRGRFLEEMEALNVEAPMDLRVNTLMTSREDALGRLLEGRIEAGPTPYSPWGLRLAARRPITGLELYRDGLIEIQDEGSQLVALLCEAEAGQLVVDFCAGGGGKSLALAVAMRNFGKIAALDVATRLAEASPRVKRAGAKIVDLHRLTDDDPWLKKHAGKADRVLVDAPCTGTGAWRRDPMSRFRLTPEELERLTALQRQILAQAAALVKPGGRLIYATCSLLREEDEDQAEWFLKTQAEFRTVPVGEIWSRTVGGECPSEGPYLVLTPKRNQTDGFFVAVFECVGVG